MRQSVSITENEALALNVIEFIAPDIDSLLQMINGLEVEVIDRKKTLNTVNAEVVYQEMNWRHKLLNKIADPNITYILMLLGIYGLIFEFKSPGAILPGVLGGIFLILALYSLQALPVNWAGVLLIVLAIVLFILEVNVTSFGMLAIGGVVAMFLGSVMLFREPINEFEPVVKVAMSLIITVTLSTLLFFFVAAKLVLSAHQRQVTTGIEGMIGEIGKALTVLSPTGQIRVHGEIWQATCDSQIEKDEDVKIISVRGLQVHVDKVTANS